MAKSEEIILGIDPGTNVMGYGVIRVTGNKAEMVVMGVIDMRAESDPYLRLGRIFERVTGIIAEYLPDEMAIEAPFFGKNVQSMLKLGRAQGVAIAAAIEPTDALGAAYCHFMQMGTPTQDTHYSSWKDFVGRNKSRVTGTL